MKRQLYVYAAIVLLYIAYNQFFRSEDARIDTIINILFASVLFGYLAYMALVALKKIKKQ